MTLKKLLHKINNRWIKLRFQPIRVFCLHHITAAFDSISMCDGDWMEIKHFQCKISNMRHIGYCFISLEDAYRKILTDVFRHRKYAVLTADDGYKSLDEILPWLIEQKIPITLFINGKYTDGESQRDEKGKHFTYLTLADLKHYIDISKGLISIQSHGYEHLNATQMTKEKFKEQIEKNMDYISLYQTQGTRHRTQNINHQFYAYTYGCHNAQTDAILRDYSLIPILVDGMKNYNNSAYVHRELLDSN